MSGRHIMIDVETLGVSVSAPVIQIGWVVFNDAFASLNSGEVEVDVLPQLMKGAKVEQATVDFHIKGNTARRAQEVISPYAALTRLSEAMDGVSTVWANSPAFDLVLLNRLRQDHTDYTPLWSHKMERDLRTVVKLAGISVTGAPTHTARDDCEQQVATLARALAGLGKGAG